MLTKESTCHQLALPSALSVISYGLNFGSEVRESLLGFYDQSSPGFLVDARPLGLDPEDIDGHFSQTNIIREVMGGLKAADPGRTWLQTGITPIMGSRDLPFHRDSVAPSPSVKVRIHYAARATRNVLFSNTPPPDFIDRAERQGLLVQSRKLGNAEQEGLERPGMFAVFVVTGGVSSTGEHVVIPTKHKFTTLDSHAVAPFWARADVSAKGRA